MDMKELKLIENELVPVYETSTGEQVVNGRELWSVLESKQQFSHWIKSRLEDCDAVENKDYTTIDNFIYRENSNLGNKTTEYIIKLDTAKEMAMLERNDVGKKVRRYFIEIEKKYKALNQNTNGVVSIHFKEIAETISMLANELRVNDAGRIAMYSNLFKAYNIPTTALPSYVDMGGRETKSATELLKRIGSNISATAFNKLLLTNGYLEERSRPSTRIPGKIKAYKALTNKGLEYGLNLTNPNNQKEVQPHYYVDKFKELYLKVIKDDEEDINEDNTN